MFNRAMQAGVIMGLAAALLWVLLTIGLTGQFLQEPDPMVLVAEIILVVTALIYGAVNYGLCLRDVPAGGMRWTGWQRRR